jgi:hypothetical protein
MRHPDGSGYNYDIAARESGIVMDSFIKYWAVYEGNGQEIRNLFSVFMRKVHEKDNYTVSLEEVYLNGRQPADI